MKDILEMPINVIIAISMIITDMIIGSDNRISAEIIIGSNITEEIIVIKTAIKSKIISVIISDNMGKIIVIENIIAIITVNYIISAEEYIILIMIYKPIISNLAFRDIAFYPDFYY